MELVALKGCFQCIVCFNRYDFGLRVPKILPCTHTICLSCARANIRQGKKMFLLCPECSAHHRLSNIGNELPTNSNIMRRMVANQEQQDQSDRRKLLQKYLEDLQINSAICQSKLDRIPRLYSTLKLCNMDCKDRVDKAIEKYLLTSEIAARQYQRQMHDEITQHDPEPGVNTTVSYGDKVMMSYNLQEDIESVIKLPVVDDNTFDTIVKKFKTLGPDLSSNDKIQFDNLLTHIETMPVLRKPLISIKFPA